MNKRLAGTGLAIGLVAGAGAGLILELSGSAGAATGSVSAAMATIGNSATDTAAPAAAVPATPATPSTRLQTVLQPLIDDGTITQAQADKVIAALAAAGPMGGRDGGPMGGGHRGPGGPGGLIGKGLDVVATTLGITADEVRTALQGGQSLADLAVSKGKTADDVINAIVAEATTQITAKVTSGDLTQAQADKLLAEVKTRTTEFVNNTAPAGGPGFGGPNFGGPGHRGGNDGDSDDAPVNTTAPTNTVAG
jgi:hypothetical protein